MRFLEILCIGGYMFGLIYSLQNVSVFQYWAFLRKEYPEHLAELNQGFLAEDDWSGTALQMAYLEVAIYFVNILTMVFLMAKSRCRRVGISNDEQFEPTYMAYVANRIIQGFLSKGASKFTERRYIDRVKNVYVEGVNLKVKLPAEEFYKIKTEMDSDDETE